MDTELFKQIYAEFGKTDGEQIVQLIISGYSVDAAIQSVIAC